jgi:CheY-like chemotaxis protein
MGTTFKILLPIVDADPASIMSLPLDAPMVLGTETILVAEDQDGVRHMTRRILEKCGYTILMADGPEEAIRLAKTYEQPIDLLLTDVVMPGMSGPELVQNLATVRPQTPVVHMSGYTDDQLQHHGVLDQDVVLIEKPFSAKGLAGTIRMVLNAKHEVVH